MTVGYGGATGEKQRPWRQAYNRPLVGGARVGRFAHIDKHALDALAPEKRLLHLRQAMETGDLNSGSGERKGPLALGRVLAQPTRALPVDNHSRRGSVRERRGSGFSCLHAYTMAALGFQTPAERLNACVASIS